MSGPSKRGRSAPFIAAAGLALVLWVWAVAWAVRSCSSGVPAEGPRPAAARIDVNSADAPTLRALPGIGGTFAERMIAEREANGPFRGPDDLMRVRSFTPELVERIRPFVLFGEPPRPAEGEAVR